MYDVTTASGALVGSGLGRFAPCIAMQEGRPTKGHKRPLDLCVNEETVCQYPSATPGQTVVLTIKRVA